LPESKFANARIKEKQSMAFEQWETIIQKIVDESTHEPIRAGKHRLLMGWRAKLEKEPPHLSPHQIDEIVREVRRRLDAAGR
jgi:hypothetical protein